MDVQTLIRDARNVYTARGYEYKGRTFWKRGPKLTRYVNIQASYWGDGVYLNLGVVLNGAWRSVLPHQAGYGRLTLRAPDWTSPHRQVFLKAQSDQFTRMAPAKLRAAIEWLVDEMETYLSDDEWVRRVVLDPECEEEASADWKMKDWAARQCEPKAKAAAVLSLNPKGRAGAARKNKRGRD